MSGWERYKAERDRLRKFVEWVAGHQLAPGVYADEEHPYDEWVTPDGDEEDFSEVVERAREALSDVAASSASPAQLGAAPSSKAKP